MLRQRLQSSHAQVGGQDERRPVPFEEQVGPEDVLSPMPPSEGLKMLVSTMMTGHDDGNHADGPIEMATWNVSRAHLYGEARRWIYTYCPQGYEQKGKLARRSVNLGRHIVRSVEGWFHDGRNCVPCTLVQSRRRSPRIVAWKRLLRGGRVRSNEERTAQIESSAKLTQPESTLYRSQVIKLAYVAQDRSDIAEAVKCLTRHMKQPRSGYMSELKRLGRYLTKNKRCVLTYPRQTSAVSLQVHVDFD